MFIGGIRALLLQSLHPLAMAAVAAHSGYRGDPWGRLQRTSYFLAVTTFGRADDAHAAIARVRRGARAGHRDRAGRAALRRRRPAPADLGAHRRGGQLPARAPPVRRPAAGPGRARRLCGRHGPDRRELGVPDPPRTEAELDRPDQPATGPSWPAPREARDAAGSCCSTRRCRWSPGRPTGAGRGRGLAAAQLGPAAAAAAPAAGGRDRASPPGRHAMVQPSAGPPARRRSAGRRHRRGFVRLATADRLTGEKIGRCRQCRRCRPLYRLPSARVLADQASTSWISSSSSLQQTAPDELAKPEEEREPADTAGALVVGRAGLRPLLQQGQAVRR